MIRTRFAPSPTGFMHLGNLRTALYAYLTAKKLKGTFILRIEDTDQNRLVEGSMEAIYNALSLSGIKYDEGPETGGDYGPYIQSERKPLYLEQAKKLIEKGGAYYCYCEKSAASHEVYRCSCPTAEKLDKPHVIRQLIPPGSTTFKDAVFGEITAENSTLENQVLIKADGLPTYNFANVVDDHLMKITHVIRGSEYLSSTPKYNLLYDAMGWKIPAYIHLPLILNENKEKLSKRRGDANYEDLLTEGFLPEAVVNYIALLGWSPGENKEIFTLQELEEAFTLEGLSKSPSIFDRAKLTWINGEYMKAMEPEKFYRGVLPYLQENIKTPVDLKKVAVYCQSRVSFFKDAVNWIDFIDRLPPYSEELFINKKMKTTIESSSEVIKKLLPVLEKTSPEQVRDTISSFTKESGLKNSQVLWPLRTALTGKANSFCGAIELIELLGLEESISRLKQAVDSSEV